MKGPLRLALGLAGCALCPTMGFAQVVTFETLAQGFTFSEPASASLREYGVVGTRAVVSAPLQPWLVGGASLAHGVVSLGGPGGRSADLSGLSDLDLFADASAGRLNVRAGLRLGVGADGFDADQLVATSLAAFEFLPVPIRAWGRGSGYNLEASVRLRTVPMRVLAFGAFHRHGATVPLFADAFEYRLGSEWRAGLLITQEMSAFSRFELSGWYSSPSDDRVLDEPVFSPGQRLGGHLLLVVPARSTSVLFRIDVEYRRQGLDPAAEAEAPFSSPIGGGIAPPGRTFVGGVVETRTSGRVPVLTSIRVRRATESTVRASHWLVGAGLGTELEIRPPWPGRTFLVPEGRLHRGSLSLQDVYTSGMALWEVGLSARWEAGR